MYEMIRTAQIIANDEFPAEDAQNDRVKAREAEFRSIWAKADLRNDRMRAAAGIEFRSLDESIRDCVESLLAIAGTSVKRREAASEPEPATV